MIKFILIIVSILAIWGGVSSAFDVENSKEEINIKINKDKVIESIDNGATKAKNMIESR